MSIKNLESKLQETMVMMQEINSLVSDSDAQIEASKDSSAGKQMIVQLKQNILNQSEKDFNKHQAKLDEPPMKIIQNDGKFEFTIDTEALKALQREVAQMQEIINFNKETLGVAQDQVMSSRKEAIAKAEIKDLLQTELDSLYNQVASILDTIKSERKTNLGDENLRKDKAGKLDSSENKQGDGYRGYTSYINDNNHIIDFNKVLNGEAQTENYNIDSVD